MPDEKRRAHMLVHAAISQGRPVRDPYCANCGLDGLGTVLRGHHEDYAKPLDVE